MPDFSKTPINTETDLNNWLKFFEVSTPLVGLGYLVSRDPVIIICLIFLSRIMCYIYLLKCLFNIYFILQGLDLRPQHFHLFSEHGQGGHYHYDTEPDTIKYTAYLSVAKNLIRIDQPDKVLSFGKD